MCNSVTWVPVFKTGSRYLSLFVENLVNSTTVISIAEVSIMMHTWHDKIGASE